jgi:hypothetical protein
VVVIPIFAWLSKPPNGDWQYLLWDGKKWL